MKKQKENNEGKKKEGERKKENGEKSKVRYGRT